MSDKTIGPAVEKRADGHVEEPGATPLKASNSVQWWREKSQLREISFTSDLPLIGGLVARFRETWNNISTKWYVRSIIQQQNEFNRLMVEWIHDYDERLTAQDREHTWLVRDAAELTAQLVQMNRLLQSIDERLARLESNSSNSAQE